MQRAWKNENVGILLWGNTHKVYEIRITVSELKKNFETMFFYIDETGNEYIKLAKKDNTYIYLGFYNPDTIKIASAMVWDRKFMPYTDLGFIKNEIESVRKGE